jgi:hypothetical protein
MSHVSSRIERKRGESRFATGVKVPMKLVHIPLRNHGALIAPSFKLQLPMQPQRQKHQSGLDELHGEDGAASANTTLESVAKACV